MLFKTQRLSRCQSWCISPIDFTERFTVDFGYADSIIEDFPQLASGVLRVEGINSVGDPATLLARFNAIAQARLTTYKESELPEIQAWRRAYSQMALKPTQYRCAAEALLRRFRKEGALPNIHPLVDICNSISLAFAIPVAVFDTSRIEGRLEVRRAVGTERYETFSGEIEHPEPGEVIFADAAGHAHARRWVNRQSAYSAVRAETTEVLIVAEALHDTAAADIGELTAAMVEAVTATWPATATVERAG